jgi:hypothetical protein
MEYRYDKFDGYPQLLRAFYFFSSLEVHNQVE